MKRSYRDSLIRVALLAGISFACTMPTMTNAYAGKTVVVKKSGKKTTVKKKVVVKKPGKTVVVKKKVVVKPTVKVKKTVVVRPKWTVGAKVFTYASTPYFFNASFGIHFGGAALNLTLANACPVGYIYYHPYSGRRFKTVAGFKAYLARHP
ncbi:MAG: hypothetical protein HKN21_02915, partial [Candidatus Eisenbacteria bacterium]|nr:hypothetical protein [Candidatus Eisenbacteria bacterium]